MTSGVYEILNTVTGHRYIGSAVNFRRRQNDHWSGLRRNGHKNLILQRAWNKYGEAAFKFKHILTCTKSMLLFYEQQFLDKAMPEYNIATVAGSTLGRVCSGETKAKISATKRANPKLCSAETREKLSLAGVGNKHGVGYKQTPKHVEKKIAAMTGKKHTEEWKANIAAGHKGKKHSEETKAKMSASLKAAWLRRNSLILQPSA